jgi:mono/diheme cytochrome c family protein
MKKTAFLTLTCALAFSSIALYGQAKGTAAKGKAVFEDNCGVCHNSDSAERKMGPGLKGLFKKAKMDSTGKAPNDANVMEKVNGGGNGMPAYKEVLSAQESADVLAFLKTL